MYDHQRSSHAAIEPSQGSLLPWFGPEQVSTFHLWSWPHPLNRVRACVWLLFEGGYYSGCGFCLNKYGIYTCIMFLWCTIHKCLYVWSILPPYTHVHTHTHESTQISFLAPSWRLHSVVFTTSSMLWVMDASSAISWKPTLVIITSGNNTHLLFLNVCNYCCIAVPCIIPERDNYLWVHFSNVGRYKLLHFWANLQKY